jgi:hypothetical protein
MVHRQRAQVMSASMQLMLWLWHWCSCVDHSCALHTHARTTELMGPRISSTLPTCVLFSRKMGALK